MNISVVCRNSKHFIHNDWDGYALLPFANWLKLACIPLSGDRRQKILTKWPEKLMWMHVHFRHQLEWPSIVWMWTSNFTMGHAFFEETPGISPNQLWTHVTHTLPLSIQPSSAVGPLPDLWIEYRHEVISSAQNSPVHKQHSLWTPLPALILKPGPWRPLTPQGWIPLSPFSCARETAVWAKLRLWPGYNRFRVQITCNLPH